MITVRTLSVCQLSQDPDFSRLANAYASESALPEIGAAFPDLEQYQAMEDARLLTIIAAYHDGALVGLINLIVATLPHYGKPVATTESFFVFREYRKSGAAKLLLDHAKGLAKAKGAAALLVCAPLDGALDKVLPIWGYRATNNVYAAVL